MTYPRFESYNPCADGLAAKVWECLRRNELFRKELRDLPDPPEKMPEDLWDDPRYGWLEYLSLKITGESNPFAEILFNSFEAWNADTPWTQLPERIREKLTTSVSSTYSKDIYDPFPSFELEQNQAFGLGPKHIPRRFRCPTPDCAANSDELSEDQIQHIASIIPSVLTNHSLAAIPRHVRDESHRKTIIEQLTALVPPPKFSGKKLKKTGAHLGSEREWECLIRFEFWKSVGYSDGISFDLTAQEIYGGMDFGETTEIRMERGKAYRNGPNKLHAHKATVEQFVNRIRGYCSKAYPQFRALSE